METAGFPANAMKYEMASFYLLSVPQLVAPSCVSCAGRLAVSLGGFCGEGG